MYIEIDITRPFALLPIAFYAIYHLGHLDIFDWRRPLNEKDRILRVLEVSWRM